MSAADKTGLKKGSVTTSASGHHGPTVMSTDADDGNEPLSMSIKRFQELGLAAETTPWFFEDWYRSFVDYVEDSYLYEMYDYYFFADSTEDGPVGVSCVYTCGILFAIDAVIIIHCCAYLYA